MDKRKLNKVKNDVTENSIMGYIGALEPVLRQREVQKCLLESGHQS